MSERRGPGGNASDLSNLVDAIIARLVRRIESQPRPVATYRVQLNSRFTFRDLEQLVPYLDSLGISHVYASPFLKARDGSPHGYDIVDHTRINPEIGTIDELRSLHRALAARGMGLIADVVPNHMSVASNANAWWLDVLENGPSSPYAGHFDIDWMPLKPDLADKVLLPVLGDQLGRVLEEGQLVLRYREGNFWVDYFEARFPIAPRSYLVILQPLADALMREVPEKDPRLLELLSILTAIRNLPLRTARDDEGRAERRREKEIIKRRLNELVSGSPRLGELLSESVRQINGSVGDPASFNDLDALLQDQAYRLAHWRTAGDEINYRRFFDINDLAAIRTEDPAVFHETHALIFELLEEGVLAGIRIDHPDGLYQPREYLRQLQEHRFLQLCRQEIDEALKGSDGGPPLLDDEMRRRLLERVQALWNASTRIPGSALAKPLYVIVEKILLWNESLPPDWPVHGTVGYDHLNAVNGLFVDPDGERAMTAAWTEFTGESLDFEELSYRCKRLIVRASMASELNVLGHRLDRISEGNRWTRDFTLPSLTRALQEVVACFGVYRTYVEPGLVHELDRNAIESAVRRAKRRNPAMSESVFDFVRDTLLLRDLDNASESERSARRELMGKFQQLTGPIMARAIEDTVFYRYNRLTSLNEVGGEPARFGSSIGELHDLNRARLLSAPLGFNTTSTHDTKRSEDVRARINVLSEIPLDWNDRIRRWCRANRRFKSTVDGVVAPGPNDEYFLYQTLAGTWPLTFASPAEKAHYVDRIQLYMRKVVREAKVHSSWVSPHDDYEAALANFISQLFADDRRRSFFVEMTEFARGVADHGCWNALAQVVLKTCSPGVPDFYQGTETWSLTLVDPDNRTPVDFEARRTALMQLLCKIASTLSLDEGIPVIPAWMGIAGSFESPVTPEVEQFLAGLVENRADGEIKLFTTMMALQARRAVLAAMSGGTYVPLDFFGEFSDHLVGFFLSHEEQSIAVVAPRWTVDVAGLGCDLPLGDRWSDTQIGIPTPLGDRTMRNVFTREVITLEAGAGSLAAARLLKHFPVAVLVEAPLET